jgi:transposase
MAAVVRALLHVIVELNTQIAALEGELTSSFQQHADAPIIESLPGLGPVLGAGALAEFGDDPTRYFDAKARKAMPLLRHPRVRHTTYGARPLGSDRHLADTCFRWAYAPLRASPGVRGYHDHHRSRGQTHNQALRAVANRLVGILHGCPAHRALYDEAANSTTGAR